MSITAYDQLRYFKNKDTYMYKNKSASDVVRMLANDFNLIIGTIENTVMKIKNRLEKDKTLFDIVGNALDLTLENTKKMYVLYDDFGKLTLKNIESMKLDVLINDSSCQDFDYKSTIDEKTANKIKLTYDNEKKGVREVYISKDSNNMNEWGVLQYYEAIDNGVNGKVKADALLKLYNVKDKNFSVRGVIGDKRVRGSVS